MKKTNSHFVQTLERDVFGNATKLKLELKIIPRGRTDARRRRGLARHLRQTAALRSERYWATPAGGRDARRITEMNATVTQQAGFTTRELEDLRLKWRKGKKPRAWFGGDLPHRKFPEQFDFILETHWADYLRQVRKLCADGEACFR